MSEQHATSYINQVVRILDEEQLDPGEKALILASLAQAEATLELVDQLRAGLKFPPGAIDAMEMFSISADQLGRRLGDR